MRTEEIAYDACGIGAVDLPAAIDCCFGGTMSSS